MSYIYTAFYQALDINGRFMNFTAAPTVTAVDGDGNATVAPTITNLATGLYKVSVTQNDLEDVIFRIVPDIVDQAVLADCNLLDMRVYHVIDDIQTDVTSLETIVESIRSIVRQYNSVVLRNTSCNDIYLQRSADFEWEAFGIGDLTGRSKLYFTVKYMKEKDDATDAQSIIQIEETAGLLYINKTAGTPANGSIVVTDALAGTITISLAAIETDKLLPNESYRYDIKMDNTIMAEGKFYISSAITRTIT